MIRKILEFEILSGRIQPGQELPSIRVLSERHHVNGNTVQHALARLRRASLVVKPRRGEPLRVTSDTKLIDALRQEKIEDLIGGCIRQLRLLGYSTEEIKTLLFDRI